MADQLDKTKAKMSDSMLDTVGTKHIFQFLRSDGFLDGWRFLSKRPKPTWVLNAKGSQTLPNLTMIKTPEGFYHFYAQVSLPKMLFGHNARLPKQNEVIEGLEIMSKYAKEQSGLPFEMETATVSLIHFAYDIHLTEPEVWKMVEKLSKRKLKPLHKQFFEDTTIYFTPKSKSKQIRIYPKFQEVLSKRNATDEAIYYADGNLRFEYAFREKSAIDALVKKYKLPNSQTQTLLTAKVSDLVISELLEKLNFFELLTTEKTNLEILLEHFSAKRASALDGFLNLIKLRGEGFYKDKSLGFSRSVYSRNVRDCRKAKVW